MTEEWLPVPGHEHYEVSDQGNVRSLSSTRDGHCPTCTCGEVLIRKGQTLKKFRGPRGHWRVALERGKQFGVHALMLEAFVGPRPDGMLALHRDDNKDNNTLPNLYWGTPSQNSYDSVRNGTHPQASRDFCKRGHELAFRSNGRRYCPECNKEASRESKRRSYTPTMTHLTDEQKAAIRQDPRASRVVAEDYGVSHATIQRVRKVAV